MSARLLDLKAPDAMITFQPGELRCPRCFGKDIVHSLPQGFFDRMMMKLGNVPRHCRSCGKRFWVRADRARAWEEDQ